MISKVNQQQPLIKKRSLFDCACLITSYSSQIANQINNTNNRSKSPSNFVSNYITNKKISSQSTNKQNKDNYISQLTSKQQSNLIQQKIKINFPKPPLSITMINASHNNQNTSIIQSRSFKRKLCNSNTISKSQNSQHHIIQSSLLKQVSHNQYSTQNQILQKRKKKFIVKNQRTSLNLNSKNSLINIPKAINNKRLHTYFRQNIISLINLLNKRQTFFNFLKTKEVQNQAAKSSLNHFNNSILKAVQIQQLLKKQLTGKGKDKRRQKFNNVTNEQLRSIKYKPKNIYISQNKTSKQKERQKDQQQSEQEQNNLSEQQVQNLSIWKRKNGIPKNGKVYIIKGGYHQLRQALKQKNWYQNQNVYSSYYDFKWTTKTSDIDYGLIKNGQRVNHFNNNHHLTSKYGLARRLKCLIIDHGINIQKFYPRCFDLGDQSDLQNFVENFKFSHAQAIAKRFLDNKNQIMDKDKFYQLILIIDIIQRKNESFSFKIQQINQGRCQSIIITPDEWAIITDTYQSMFLQYFIQKQLKKYKIYKIFQNQINSISEQPIQCLKNNQIHEKITSKIRSIFQVLFNKVQQLEPQNQLNGMRNIWIVKPNFLSRGRGIRCFNNINQIADYTLGKDVQFVAQKYIQNPFLIEGRKFDIRQWVYIQDYNPPKIWFYNNSYLRFCVDQYDIDDISNKFMHLTNHSIQKYNKNMKKDIQNKNLDKKGLNQEYKLNYESSMWSINEFKYYLTNWATIEQKMKNIIVWSIKSCQGFVTGKKGFCELVGYDFMIDQNLNPWLIEINMSPSMDTSTPVTKKLVKDLMADVASLITLHKKPKSKGQLLITLKSNKSIIQNNPPKDIKNISKKCDKISNKKQQLESNHIFNKEILKQKQNQNKQQQRKVGDFTLIYQKQQDLLKYQLYRI